MGGRGSMKRCNATTSRLQGGVFDNGANIGIVFAIGGRGKSPLNPPWIMHTPRGRREDVVEVARYLWEGERNRWEISKGVVAKSSKNVIKLST
jgi:hypothetical protein